MNSILAIDPGTTESAFVIWDGSRILDKGFQPNVELLSWLTHNFDSPAAERGAPTQCAIEMIASFGMPVGRETFVTVLWIGKFCRQMELTFGLSVKLIYRRDVKLYLCGSSRAKDGNIRQAIIDRLGPPGKKSCPGVTHGISKHLWSALAVALTADSLNTQAQERPSNTDHET